MQVLVYKALNASTNAKLLCRKGDSKVFCLVNIFSEARTTTLIKIVQQQLLRVFFSPSKPRSLKFLSHFVHEILSPFCPIVWFDWWPIFTSQCSKGQVGQSIPTHINVGYVDSYKWPTLCIILLSFIHRWQLWNNFYNINRRQIFDGQNSFIMQHIICIKLSLEIVSNFNIQNSHPHENMTLPIIFHHIRCHP